MNSNKNFGFTHKSGILLHVSSLPSKYGIGSFGKEAFDFIDFLSETKQKCWQVLPLNPTSYGDSPYQSVASVAGNPYFIDLFTLYKKGLLSKGDLKNAEFPCSKVDYGYLFSTRFDILRKAHSKFKPDRKYRAFLKKHEDFIYDYALFMALKVKYNYSPWTSWDDCHRDYHRAKLLFDEFEGETDFWMWVQYEFTMQWQAILDYAHSKKILIIGDIPIYVAHDSMDVWKAREEFLLDENYMPKLCAGCPPDGFAEDGQLWGNPIYDWKHMEDNDFQWFCNRVRRSFELYDIVRIDHFRGFASYYAIPYGEKTARNGSWISAPGKELFAKIKEKVPKAKIIAEDLGFITDDVRELLKATAFPGMKILQFAFDEENSEYLPKMYKSENYVVYTGSHDSECTRTFIKNMSEKTKEIFTMECKHNIGMPRVYDLIKMAHESKANLSVIPMQDYLNLESADGRMNTPSISEGNWQWRLSPRYASRALKEKIKDITIKAKRNTK